MYVVDGLTPELQLSLEQFYFYEARLLDDRQFKSWLQLIDPAISYTVPSRVNVMVDNRDRDTESMLAVDRELEGADSMGCPLREETFIHLTLRVDRAYKINAWAEQPPARTRRIIGNVTCSNDEAGVLDVVSNFHLSLCRPGSESCTYSGQRRDQLRCIDGGFRILRRDVILDYALIETPTMGLFF